MSFCSLSRAAVRSSAADVLAFFRDNDEGVMSFMEKRPANFTGTLERDAPPVYPWWAPVDIGPTPEAGDVGEKEKAKL